jgi:hypothetical protein
MVQFYETYSDDKFVILLASLKLPESSGKLKSLIVPTLSAQSENTERESENTFFFTTEDCSVLLLLS